MEDGSINIDRSLRQPLVVHESLNVLQMMGQLRKSPLQMAVVLDEYGSFEGIVTPFDVLEAIAGKFPDEYEDMMTIQCVRMVHGLPTAGQISGGLQT